MKKSNYRKFLATAVTASITVSSVAPGIVSTAAVEGKQFSDIKTGDFGSKEIIALSSTGVINGYPNGSYKPFQVINRSQMAVLFTRAFKLDVPQNLNSFADINSKSLYAKEIAAVKQAGIFNGSNGKFLPASNLTREQMATVLVRAFDLKGNGNPVPLSDLDEISPSHLENVKILYQNGITTGKQDGSFAPRDSVNRVQAAVFLYRAIFTQQSMIEAGSIGENTIQLNGVTYEIAENLKGILNKNNQAILTNAVIRFEKSENKITSIKTLEIKASGEGTTSSEVEFSKNLVLDGGNSVIDGHVTINSNYVSLNNLIIKGDFVISEKLENDFHSVNLRVEGETYVNGGDENTVVFEDAKLKIVAVNKQDVRVVFNGNSSEVAELSVTADATVTANPGFTIPKVKVSATAKSVKIDAKVGTIDVDTTGPLTVTGNLELDEVNITTEEPVTFNSTGTIKKLVVTGTSKVTLQPGVVIDDLILPEGVEPKDVFENYEQIKESIVNVGGVKNPDVPATPPPSTGGGTPPITVTPSVTKVSLSGVNLNLSGFTFSGNIPDNGSFRNIGLTVNVGSTYVINHVYDKSGRDLLPLFSNATKTGTLIAGAQNIDLIKAVLGLDLPAGETIPASLIKKISSELNIHITLTNNGVTSSYILKLIIGDQTPADPGTPTIDEGLAYIIKVYENMPDTLKVAFNEAAGAVNGLTSAQWTTILGDIESNANAKLLAANSATTADVIFKELAHLIFSSKPDTLKANVGNFRDSYKDEFDIIFGKEVTVDLLLQYSHAFQQKLGEADNFAALVNLKDSVNKQAELKVLFDTVRDQVEAEDSKFSGLSAKLRAGIGTGIDGLFIAQQKLVNEISSSITNKEEFRAAVLLFIQTNLISGVNITSLNMLSGTYSIASAADYDLRYETSDSDGIVITDTYRL